jgi:hypothetical protein
MYSCLPSNISPKDGVALRFEEIRETNLSLGSQKLKIMNHSPLSQL